MAASDIGDFLTLDLPLGAEQLESHRIELERLLRPILNLSEHDVDRDTAINRFNEIQAHKDILLRQHQDCRTFGNESKHTGLGPCCIKTMWQPRDHDELRILLFGRVNDLEEKVRDLEMQLERGLAQHLQAQELE
jgi:hypothetical protein